MGDFVLTGGEIPAMAVADAVCRMVPGVLPDEECFTEESHWNGLLEYPQYSRPDEWHGRRVPDVLLSGHHGNVEKWRASRATSARCCAAPTCGRSLTRACAKPRASASCSPRPRPRRRRCVPARSLHLPMINDRSGVPVCGRDAVFFAALFLGGARNLSSTFSSGHPYFC